MFSLYLPGASASLTRSSMALSSTASPGLPSHLCLITPLGSMTNKVGQPCRAHSSAIDDPLPPRLLRNERQVICCFSFLALSVSAESVSSPLTPRRTKGLPSSFFTSDRSCGNIATQGPHQCAQKSSKT